MDIDQSIDVRQESLVDRLVVYTATLLFTLTVVLATAQVIIRFTNVIPGDRFYWTVPLARLTFIVMTYMGAAVAIRNREHISIEMLLDRLERRNPRARRVLDVLVTVVVASFLAVVLYGLVLSTTGNWTSPIGGLTGVTSGYVYFGMGLGIFFMLLYTLQRFVMDVRALRAGSSIGPETSTFTDGEEVD
jgi:TRAP-type C4-dicarboxylate transport system permease small subunit